MFITFKSSRPSASNGGMRQVTAANAGLGTARRSACVNCQRKKVRCTGDVNTCDDCKDQQIACVPGDSARRKRARKRKAVSRQTNDVELSAIDPAITQACEPTRAGQDDGIPRQPPPPPLTPANEFEHGENLNIPDAYPGSSSVEPMATMSFSEDGSLSLMTPHPSDQTSQVQSCSCVEDTLQVVQRLDDDEFHLKSLSIDQILKLQKWLVFQCLRPLQCDQCGSDLGAQSAVLIICNRIVEMFVCSSQRLRRLLRGLCTSAQQVGMEAFEILQLPEMQATSHVVSPDEGEDGRNAQLFDGEAGKTGVIATCTLHLFSEDFRKQYSSDEQCRMIHVLAKMQIENCARLLDRLCSVCQSQPARSGKIQTMQKRLTDTSNSIDETLEAISRAFSFPT